MIWSPAGTAQAGSAHARTAQAVGEAGPHSYDRLVRELGVEPCVEYFLGRCVADPWGLWATSDMHTLVIAYIGGCRADKYELVEPREFYEIWQNTFVKRSICEVG